MTKLNSQLVDFFKKNSELSLDFLNVFYGIKATEKDIKNIRDFSETIKLRIQGLQAKNISGTELIEKIIDEENIAIRSKNINNQRKKLKEVENIEMRSKKLITLGIESTAH